MIQGRPLALEIRWGLSWRGGRDGVSFPKKHRNYTYVVIYSLKILSPNNSVSEIKIKKLGRIWVGGEEGFFDIYIYIYISPPKINGCI